MPKKDLQIPITDRVKKELAITENYDNFTLFKLLCKARNSSHPDHYPEELKLEAENKCKTLNSLITEFNLFLNQEKLNRPSNEIILYEDLYNEVKINVINSELQSENEKLKKDIKNHLSTIESLKKSLDDAQTKNLSESQDELVKIYKPQRINFLVPGITAILLFAINIISTLTTIKDKIKSIIPFGMGYLNIALFFILLISILDLFLKKIRLSKVQQISNELTSSDVIKRFHDSYSKEHSEYYRTKYFFLESDVSRFIQSNYCARRYRKVPMSYIEGLFVITNYKSINYLKDIFIENLIKKKLIDIGGSKELDREFHIKN